VADEPLPSKIQDSAPSTDTAEERRAKGYSNLIPAKPGETHNPKGVNGWRRAQSLIAAFLDEPAEAGKPATRFQSVLMAAYETALIPGIKGSADRKLLVEQKAGKAKQQVEFSGQDGEPLRVVAYLPDNGRGPGDPDPDDGESGAPEVAG
jgi:hypothetical protein